MTYTRILGGIILGLSILLFSSAVLAESTREDKLKNFITELETKIQYADKRMVAHPSFLDELRSLVAKYKSGLRTVFFKDGFDDGEFTKDPRWIVRAGSFSVNGNGRLASLVEQKPAAQDTPDEQDLSLEQVAVGILLDSVFGSGKSKDPDPKAPEAPPDPSQPAFIFTKAGFPPAFEFTMEFTLSGTGETELLLFGEKKLVTRYRLRIRANDSGKDPVELIRQSDSRKFVVGAAARIPVIDDGKVHQLSWIRRTDGAMTVSIDGEAVLKTYEVHYRDDFTGFGIRNRGGSQQWDNVTIYNALAAE